MERCEIHGCVSKMFRLPLDGFWENLILEFFPKICREDSSLIKI